MTGTDLVVDMLATYRVTRLLVQDKITEPVRNAVEEMAVEEIAEGDGRCLSCGHLRQMHHARGCSACDRIIALPDLACSGYADVARIVEVQPWSFLSDLLDCPWCTGIYIGFGIRLLPRPMRRALALAAMAGLLSEVVQWLDQTGDTAEEVS